MSSPSVPSTVPAVGRRLSGWWALLGLVVGFAGLAISYALSLLLSTRDSPVQAVADLAIRLTPGPLVEWAVRALGFLDKPLLIAGILLILAVLFALSGVLARASVVHGLVVYLAIAAVGFAALSTRSGFGYGELLPLAGGAVTWCVLLPWLSRALSGGQPLVGGAEGPAADVALSRRTFLGRASLVTAGVVVATVAGRWVGGARRSVEEARRLLRLDGVSKPAVPDRVRIGVDGVSPWQTPTDDFYLVHANYSLPAIEPKDWQLRIHGMVSQERTYTYSDLVDRDLTESWITLSCVSNPVGGDLIGNAWWSGVRVADLLAEAGVLPGADAVLQTSDTGWTCGTPLEAMTDDRNAMLAVAMNGEPLTIEHGFPVRTVVPGLYGYVSACKWVVDFEVTRFADITAYWTERGWSELGPVKIASRIDVPGDGDTVASGEYVAAGVAWLQHIGISGVEVSLDEGQWQQAELAGLPKLRRKSGEAGSPGRPNRDTWVQWRAALRVEPGDHELRVRAIDVEGNPQTGDLAEPAPDGATGWHTVSFTAE